MTAIYARPIESGSASAADPSSATVSPGTSLTERVTDDSALETTPPEVPTPEAGSRWAVSLQGKVGVESWNTKQDFEKKYTGAYQGLQVKTSWNSDGKVDPYLAVVGEMGQMNKTLDHSRQAGVPNNNAVMNRYGGKVEVGADIAVVESDDMKVSIPMGIYGEIGAVYGVAPLWAGPGLMQDVNGYHGIGIRTGVAASIGGWDVGLDFSVGHRVYGTTTKGWGDHYVGGWNTAIGLSIGKTFGTKKKEEVPEEDDTGDTDVGVDVTVDTGGTTDEDGGTTGGTGGTTTGGEGGTTGNTGGTTEEGGGTTGGTGGTTTGGGSGTTGGTGGRTTGGGGTTGGTGGRTTGGGGTTGGTGGRTTGGGSATSGTTTGGGVTTGGSGVTTGGGATTLQDASAHPFFNKVEKSSSTYANLKYSGSYVGYIKISDLNRAKAKLMDAKSFYQSIISGIQELSVSRDTVRYLIPSGKSVPLLGEVKTGYHVKVKTENDGQGGLISTWSYAGDVSSWGNNIVPFKVNSGSWKITPVAGYKDLYSIAWKANNTANPLIDFPVDEAEINATSAKQTKAAFEKAMRYLSN